MFDRQFQLFFEQLGFTFRDRYILFHPKPSPSDRELARRRFGVPVLHEGMQADHLTIPLGLRKHGRNAGCIEVHLTWHSGGTSIHKTVAALDPADLASFGERMTVRYLAMMRESMHPVDLSLFARRGFKVLVPRDELVQSFDAFLAKPPRSLRLRKEDLEERLPNLMQLDALARIETDVPERWRTGPLFLIRNNGRTVKRVTIGFFKNGYLGGPPGWYSLPDDESFTVCMDRLFAEALGPKAIEVLTIIARELEYDLELDRPFNTIGL
ncbi:MAG: hypothetical protein EPO40_18775 [Myxococcaceae bacterium]|nr:MAG: hypothetical protein EPO40_18775 [Myxococcaceae bacterium]